MNHGGAVCLPTRVNLYAVLMRCHRLLYLVQKGRQRINIERKRPITDNIDALCELLNRYNFKIHVFGNGSISTNNRVILFPLNFAKQMIFNVYCYYFRWHFISYVCIF